MGQSLDLTRELVLNSLAQDCHENAVEKGFYADKQNVFDLLAFSEPTGLEPEEFDKYKSVILWLNSTTEQAAIARMHSELSEWLEGIRKDPTKADDHCPEFLSAEIEAADLIIRVMDTCGERGYRIGAAVVAKMAYNRSRPYKHGKNS